MKKTCKLILAYQASIDTHNKTPHIIELYSQFKMGEIGDYLISFEVQNEIFSISFKNAIIVAIHNNETSNVIDFITLQNQNTLSEKSDYCFKVIALPNEIDLTSEEIRAIMDNSGMCQIEMECSRCRGYIDVCSGNCVQNSFSPKKVNGKVIIEM